MILYIYYTFMENSKLMAFIKKYFCRYSVLIGILIVLLIIFGRSSLVNAQQPQLRSGPPIYCGMKAVIEGTVRKFKEAELSVLAKLNPEGLYFILFRNLNTGSWTIVAHNVPNIPSSYSCIMLSGNSSFILPDMKELQKALDKQKEGLDEQIDPALESES
jgi:hypothetical protein